MAKAKSGPAKSGPTNTVRTIVLAVSVLAILGVAVWLASYFNLFGGAPAAPKSAEMTPEVQQDWQKAQADQEKARAKINKPPSGS